jgi:hypothetical protein
VPAATHRVADESKRNAMRLLDAYLARIARVEQDDPSGADA